MRECIKITLSRMKNKTKTTSNQKITSATQISQQTTLKSFDKKFLVGTVFSTIFAVVTADALQNIGTIFYQVGGKEGIPLLCKYPFIGNSLLYDLKKEAYFFSEFYITPEINMVSPAFPPCGASKN